MLHVRHHRREEMRDPLVHRELQHLRVDHDHPYVGSGRLVEEAQDHRVDGHGLARSGGPRHQKVGHLRQIHDHRLPEMSFPQRQREMGGVGVVLGGLEHVAQHHDLPLLVGDLESDGGLAGDDLHDAHAHGGERTGEVLGKARDPAHLQPRSRLHLVARDDGSGVHRDDLDRDAEIRELELDLARHRFEGLVRNPPPLLFRRVEERERWPRLGARDRLEQRRLPLPLRPHARLDLRDRRCDARRPAALLGFALRFEPGLVRRAFALQIEPGLVRCAFALLFEPGSTRLLHPAGEPAFPRLQTEPVETLCEGDGVAARHVHHLQPGQPVNSVTPVRNRASRNRVPPRGLTMSAKPLPTKLPMIPPASAGSAAEPW